MSDIEWTDETWNPVTGCTKVSPGCAHCYAETFAERFRGVPGHPFEQGFDLKLWPERLTKPFTWKKPRKVFVNSMSDLFHEDVSDYFIADVWAAMARAQQHTFQILTKRPERMRKLLNSTEFEGLFGAALQFAPGVTQADLVKSVLMPLPLPNVWMGVSVENQRWADIRIPELLATPAAVRFLSCEPLLGPLDFDRYHPEFGTHYLTGLDEHYPEDGQSIAIDWVIVGGESGPKARPFDLAWARSIVAQCRAAGVPVFVKQLGAKPVGALQPIDRVVDAESEHVFRGPALMHLKSRKGGAPDEWPEDLRVREWPV